MKHLVLAACVALSGCVAVPVTQHFPKAPDTLQEAPPELKLIPQGASASQTFDVVIDNYGTYHDVAAKLRGWQQWYVEQQKIFDSVQ